MEHTDRALPEMGFIENRDNWNDLMKDYSKVWADTVSASRASKFHRRGTD